MGRDFRSEAENRIKTPLHFNILARIIHIYTTLWCVCEAHALDVKKHDIILTPKHNLL